MSARGVNSRKYSDVDPIAGDTLKKSLRTIVEGIKIDET